MTTFTGTANEDVFFGQDTVSDLFFFTGATLGSNDTLHGGGVAGDPIDTLKITGPDDFQTSFADVVGIERVLLGPATYLELGKNILTSSSTGFVTVVGTASDDVVRGYQGKLLAGQSISFLGGDGRDHVLGTWANDTLVGGSANDVLDGSRGADSIDGGVGNDILAGGSGSVLSGGAGNDILKVNDDRPGATINGGDGFDLVQFGKLRINEGIILTSIEGINGSVAATPEQLAGFTHFRGGGNLLLLGGGTLDLSGLTDIPRDWHIDVEHRVRGNIEIVAALTRNTLVGAIGHDTLTGNALNDVIMGNQGNDLISGGRGNDRLVGGPGNDSMDGGEGNDLLDNSSSSIFIPVTIITGQDTLSGGAGRDRFEIAFRSDTIVTADGGSGNDSFILPTYLVAGARTRGLIDGGTGFDSIATFDGGHLEVLGSYSIRSIERLDISPSLTARADQLEGISGLYASPLFQSLTFTLSGSGSVNLGAKIKNYAGPITVMSTGPGNLAITGTKANDTLLAGDGHDTLNGGNGDDFLGAVTGSSFTAGADLFIGGYGNDTVAAQHQGDTVQGGAGNDEIHGEYLSPDSSIAHVDGGAGFDTLISHGKLSGVVNVERLVLDAYSTIDASIAQLNQFKIITGPDSAESPTIFTLRGPGALDLRQLPLTSFGVHVIVTSFDGAAVSAPGSFDTMDGGGGGDSLDGGAGFDIISGANGNDSLSGGDSFDLLTGGSGDDTLLGGNDNDIFGFNATLDVATNVDLISDFAVGEDRIRLTRTIFTTFTGADVTADDFVIGNQAQTPAQKLIYDAASGNLFYDSDGSGAEAQVLFARLAANLALTHESFILE
ncbi:hypothetical protein BH10PSE7_BH10PSE7_02640 [soil metagenome]